MLAALLCLMIQTPQLPAQQAPEGGGAERFLLRVERLHPLGNRATILQRLGHKLKTVREEDPTQGTLDLKRASFRTRVPATYQAARPAGLIVWMDPSDKGDFPETWSAILDRRNLIAVAPNSAGSHQFAWNRAGLALAAVHALVDRYMIDPARIYVAGQGSGGRMVARLALGWPDVFQGGIAIGGAAYFEAIPNPRILDGSWPARLKRPKSSLLRHARTRSRFVFMAGSEDPKRSLCRAQALHMLNEAEFQHVVYLEVPRLGSEVPEASWIRRAIDSLDAPLLLKAR